MNLSEGGRGGGREGYARALGWEREPEQEGGLGYVVVLVTAGR